MIQSIGPSHKSIAWRKCSYILKLILHPCELLHHLTGQLLLFSLPRIFFTPCSSSLNVTFIGKALPLLGHFLLWAPNIYYFIYSVSKYLLYAYYVLGMILSSVYPSTLLLIIQILIHLTPIEHLMFGRLCAMYILMHCGNFFFFFWLLVASWYKLWSCEQTFNP